MDTCKFCGTAPNNGDQACSDFKAAKDCPWLEPEDRWRHERIIAADKREAQAGRDATRIATLESQILTLKADLAGDAAMIEALKADLAEANKRATILENQVERFRGALAPFAEVAVVFDSTKPPAPTADGHAFYQWFSHVYGERELLVGDFRHARNVLDGADYPFARLLRIRSILEDLVAGNHSATVEQLARQALAISYEGERT